MPTPDESAAPEPKGKGSDSGTLDTGGPVSGKSTAALPCTSKSSPTSPMVEELDLDATADEPAVTIEPDQHLPLLMPENRVAPPSRARRTKRLPSPNGGKQLENPDLSIGSYQQNTPEDDEYAVEFVFARRWSVVEDRFEYLVKWQDYDHTHDSWEPMSNFVSADGGLTLRFVEFMDANPNFDDEHHGADHLEIDVVFQSFLPFGVVVDPQAIPAWTQPDGAYHEVNNSLTSESSQSSDASSTKSAGSAAPPYRASPPQATSSPAKTDGEDKTTTPKIIVTGKTVVTDIKVNPFADVAADATITRARAAAQATALAERTAFAQAMITSQLESDMRVIQAEAEQQLSCIQAIEEAKIAAGAERADVAKLQASYVLKSDMKVINRLDGLALLLQQPGIVVGQPAPELVLVSHQVWNTVEHKFVNVTRTVRSDELRPATPEDEKFFAIRTPPVDLISFDNPTHTPVPLMPLADLQVKVETPVVAAPTLMYMPEHKIVVKLIGEPYKEHSFERTITKILVEAVINNKQFVADLDSLTPYTDMMANRTPTVVPPKRRTYTTPSMLQPASPRTTPSMLRPASQNTGRFVQPVEPGTPTTRPTDSQLKIGDLVWNEDLQDEGRITVVQDQFPGITGVFVCVLFNKAGTHTVHSSTVDLVTTISARHARMARNAFDPSSRTQFSAQRRSFERASLPQPNDRIDTAVPDPHFRSPDGYALEARRPAWVQSKLPAEKQMSLGASIVRFIRSVQEAAFLANQGRTPTHAEFMFDLFSNCEPNLKKKLMIDGTLDSQAAFEHRLDHLCPASMKRTTASTIAQLLEKKCPNANKLVAWIQVIKEVVLSCVDRDLGDVIPTSLGAYDRQVASMHCQFDSQGVHLVLALVMTITHTIEMTMPDDTKSFLIVMPNLFKDVQSLQQLDELETNLTRLAESMFPQKAPKVLTMFGNIFAEETPPGLPDTPAAPGVEVPTLQQQAKVAEKEEKRALQKARVAARKANTAAGLPPSKLKDFRCNHCVKRHENGNPCGCASWDHYSVLCTHKPTEEEFKKMVCADCSTNPKWDEKRRGYMSIGHTKGSISCHNRYHDRKAATAGGK